MCLIGFFLLSKNQRLVRMALVRLFLIGGLVFPRIRPIRPPPSAGSHTRPPSQVPSRQPAHSQWRGRSQDQCSAARCETISPRIAAVRVRVPQETWRSRESVHHQAIRLPTSLLTHPRLYVFGDSVRSNLHRESNFRCFFESRSWYVRHQTRPKVWSYTEDSSGQLSQK